MWHNVSHTSRTINSAKGIRFGQKIIFSIDLTMRKREMRERKRFKASFSYLRSSVGRNSSSQELKFIYSMRATRTYQNRRISSKIKKLRFGGNQRRGLGGSVLKASHPFFYAPRDRGSSYFG